MRNSAKEPWPALFLFGQSNWLFCDRHFSGDCTSTHSERASLCRSTRIILRQRTWTSTKSWRFTTDGWMALDFLSFQCAYSYPVFTPLNFGARASFFAKPKEKESMDEDKDNENRKNKKKKRRRRTRKMRRKMRRMRKRRSRRWRRHRSRNRKRERMLFFLGTKSMQRRVYSPKGIHLSRLVYCITNLRPLLSTDNHDKCNHIEVGTQTVQAVRFALFFMERLIFFTAPCDALLDRVTAVHISTLFSEERPLQATVKDPELAFRMQFSGLQICHHKWHLHTPPIWCILYVNAAQVIGARRAINRILLSHLQIPGGILEITNSKYEKRVLAPSVLTFLEDLRLSTQWAQSHWETQPSSLYSTAADQCAAAAIAQAIATCSDEGNTQPKDKHVLSLADAHLDSAEAMSHIVHDTTNSTVVCLSSDW